MAQPTSDELWPPLLKAWALHLVFAFLAFAVPFAVWFFAVASAPNAEDVQWGYILGSVIPIFIAGLVLSAIAPWRYLKKRGIKNAGLITLLGVVAGLMLPFGSIIGFLGGGYLLERDARNKPAA